MKKLIAAAALAAVAVAPAHAALFSLSAPGVQTTAVAGATVVDFNDYSIGAYTSAVGQYQIVQGNLAGKYAAPKGDTTPFLSVPNPVSNGQVTFQLGTLASYFGLYWGSIDSYNTLEFLRDGAVVASFTGSQITAVADGNQAADRTNRYVNFSFGAGEHFNAVRLKSTGFAFESDNHAFVAVPAPAAVGLLGLGLLGFCAARRRSR